MRAGLLHDKFKKRKGTFDLHQTTVCWESQCLLSSGWREHHRNTEEVYYFMQIPHELPLITTLLPQRPAFTAVNQSTSDNKQQKETGAVNGLSTPAIFHDFIAVRYFPKLCLLRCNCSSSSAGWPYRKTSRKCNTWGKAVAAGWLFFQVKAIDQWESRESEGGQGGWVRGNMVQRKLQVWGRENTITSQVKQTRLRRWRWIEGQHSSPRWRSPPLSPRSSLSLRLLLLLLLGQTSGHRERERREVKGGREVEKVVEREREREREREKEGWTWGWKRRDEVRSGEEVKDVKRTAVFIFGTPAAEGAHISELVSVGESSHPPCDRSPFLFIFICFTSFNIFLTSSRQLRTRPQSNPEANTSKSSIGLPSPAILQRAEEALN